MDEHVLYNRKLAQSLQQANSEAAHSALTQLLVVLAVVLLAMAAGGTLLCRAISQACARCSRL